MQNPSTQANARTADAVVHMVRGLIWVLIVVAAIPTNAEPDLWGNLRFGLDLLASWRISTDDIYSFTQDVPWMNHEWLAQVMMAIAYTLGGTPGLVLLKLGLVLPTLLLVRGVLAGARGFLPEVGCLLALWAALPTTGTLRAQLWTFLFLAVLVRLLLATRPRLALVPLLFVVWVNSHIGWVMGLAVLTWWAIGVVIRESGAQRTGVIAVVVLSFGATLVNPYGWNLWDFTVGVTHMSRHLQEWQPLWSSPVINWIPWILAVIALIAALARPPRPTFDRVASLVGLAYVSCQVVKFAPFFVELTVLFLGPLVRFHWPARPAPVLAPGLRRANEVALAIVAIAAVYVSWPRLRCLPSSEWRPDATVARALLDAAPAGRMAVWFDWGEYSIWHFGSNLKVSFDPRYDSVYSTATIEEQEHLATGTPQGTAFLTRTHPEYVWYPSSKTALRDWVAANGYRIDVETGESFLAVRADLPVITRPAAAQSFGCFPAP